VVLPIIEPLAGKNNSAALGPDLADALAAAAEAAGLTWRTCCRNCMETAAAVSAEYCSIVCRSSIWTMPVLSLGKPQADTRCATETDQGTAHGWYHFAEGGERSPRLARTIIAALCNHRDCWGDAAQPSFA
jgi:hypothetical protein